MKVIIGNIFDSKCTTIVNTINCIGVMGKGIALEFKKRYPNMYYDYVEKCHNGQVKTGTPYIFDNCDGTKILNFPTKDHWRSPSRLSYITEGLDWFVENFDRYGITSIAFPPLGCGNGGLTWEIVGPIMYQKLKNLPIEVEIYAPFGTGLEKTTDEYLSESAIYSEEILGKNGLKINPKWYLILQTIRELNERAYSLKVGRTIYQKLCYALTRNGVETGFVFTKGDYGPYSIEAKESILALANSNLITERTLGRMISLNVPTDVVINRNKFTESEWLAVKKTVDLFARIKSTEQAEMVATVLYAYDELHKEHPLTSDKDVYDYVMSWKPHWKESKHIEVCDTIYHLAMLAFIKVVHSNMLTDTTSD